MIDCTITGESGVTWINVKGRIDSMTSPEIQQQINDLILRGERNLVANLEEVNYISSAGLGVFMAYIEDVRKNKGDIKLTNMSPKVYNVFDLLGFPILYEIFKDETEAVKKFTDAVL